MSKPVTHVPSTHAVITRDMADAAAELLARGVATGDKVSHRAVVAANMLLKLYFTQDRYTEERLQELARKPKASQGVRDLAALTDEELNRMTATILDETPPA